MTIKSKNTERMRRHNLHTAEIHLLGQNGGRVFLSISEQTNPIVYEIDQDSFLKHFVFTSSIEDLPFWETSKSKDSGIQIVKI
jgi:hypothetical protein